MFLWNSLNGCDALTLVDRAGFNPCFCGIRSTATDHANAGLDRGFWFQSLFLWNSLNGSRIKAWIAAGQTFQSLFLWNSLNGLVIEASQRP